MSDIPGQVYVEGCEPLPIVAKVAEPEPIPPRRAMYVLVGYSRNHYGWRVLSAYSTGERGGFFVRREDAERAAKQVTHYVRVSVVEIPGEKVDE